MKEYDGMGWDKRTQPRPPLREFALLGISFEYHGDGIAVNDTWIPVTGA